MNENELIKLFPDLNYIPPALLAAVCTSIRNIIGENNNLTQAKREKIKTLIDDARGEAIDRDEKETEIADGIINAAHLLDEPEQEPEQEPVPF